jgi:hypothetical protein
MSEIITPNVDTEVSKVTNQTASTPELKIINSDSNLEISKLSKDYKFWARFNQVLIIIGGVFSLPVGALAIVGAVKFNKSIEIVDETSKDAKTQEFIESVKDLQKWSVINIFGAWIFGIFIGIAFGAIIFATITAGINSDKKFEKSFPSSNSNFDTGYRSKNSDYESKTDSMNKVNDSTGKAFNISTEEGTVTMDKEGNMKVVDKDGKVTSVNIDGTMSTDEK